MNAFFTTRYFVACAVLIAIGIFIIAKSIPIKAKPEEITITSTDWICVDSRPAGLHAQCTNLVLKNK